LARSGNAKKDSIRLIAAFALRSRTLRVAVIRALGSEAATVTPPPAMHAVTLLALALVMAIGTGALRLRLVAAGDERRQANFLPAVAARLRLILLRLGARDLLVARRKRLRIARQIGLRLRLRRVARLVLSAERLFVFAFVVAIVDSGRALTLLRRLIVIGVLLAKLLLRRGDQTEIMLGVLIVVFSGYRIARALCVTRELNIFFRNMRGGTADLYVRPVRLIDPR